MDKFLALCGVRGGARGGERAERRQSRRNAEKSVDRAPAPKRGGLGTNASFPRAALKQRAVVVDAPSSAVSRLPKLYHETLNFAEFNE